MKQLREHPINQNREELLGDKISSCLEKFGITQERVSSFLGEPCNCPERIEKLNRLHRFIRQSIKLTKEKAKEYLEQILNED